MSGFVKLHLTRKINKSDPETDSVLQFSKLAALFSHAGHEARSMRKQNPDLSPQIPTKLAHAAAGEIQAASYYVSR
jgi:hypothetical protein